MNGIIYRGILALIGTVVAVVGYIANIVKLAGALEGNVDPVTGTIIIQIFGVFIPPLGCVMGYVA